jgi:hypothetical protein
LNSYRERAGLASGSISDEVKYAFTKALRRAVRPTFPPLFEPHCEQNLYANPKRTAKSIRNYLIDSPHDGFVQIIFFTGPGFISDPRENLKIVWYLAGKSVNRDVCENFGVTSTMQNMREWCLSIW